MAVYFELYKQHKGNNPISGGPMLSSNMMIMADTDCRMEWRLKTENGPQIQNCVLAPCPIIELNMDRTWQEITVRKWEWSAREKRGIWVVSRNVINHLSSGSLLTLLVTGFPNGMEIWFRLNASPGTQRVFIGIVNVKWTALAQLLYTENWPAKWPVCALKWMGAAVPERAPPREGTGLVNHSA